MKSKKKIDRNKLYFENITGKILVKYVGDLNGSSFNCINLNECIVFVFDNTSQLIIDKCNRSKFYLGATKFALIIRNSNDCLVNSISSQLRLTNCINLTVHGYSATSPGLEGCKHLKLGVCRLNYLKIKEILDKSEIQQNTNSIFTPIDFIAQGQKDTLYKLIVDDETRVEKFLVEGEDDQCPDPNNLPGLYNIISAIEQIDVKQKEKEEAEARRKAEEEAQKAIEEKKKSNFVPQKEDTNSNSNQSNAKEENRADPNSLPQYYLDKNIIKKVPPKENVISKPNNPNENVTNNSRLQETPPVSNVVISNIEERKKNSESSNNSSSYSFQNKKEIFDDIPGNSLKDMPSLPQDQKEESKNIIKDKNNEISLFAKVKNESNIQPISSQSNPNKANIDNTKVETKNEQSIGTEIIFSDVIKYSQKPDNPINPYQMNNSPSNNEQNTVPIMNQNVNPPSKKSSIE